MGTLSLLHTYNACIIPTRSGLHAPKPYRAGSATAHALQNDVPPAVLQAAAAAQDVSQLAAQTQAQLRLVGSAAARAAEAAGPLRIAAGGIVTTSMAQRVKSGGAAAERRKGAALVDAAQTLLPPLALQVSLRKHARHDSLSRSPCVETGC